MSINRGQHVSYNEFDVNKIEFGELSPGENGSITFEQVSIKYNYGTGENPNIDSLVIKLPELGTKGIKDFDKTDDDGNITGKQYVLSILLNPQSGDGLYTLIDDIWVQCFTHLYMLHKEQKLSYVEDDILEIVNLSKLDGKKGTKGMLIYPIKFPPNSREGKTKKGKVLNDALGYLGLNISEDGYYKTKFIVPDEEEPEELTLDEMMGYGQIQHVSYLSLSRIFLGEFKSLKFYLRQLYMLDGNDGSASIIDIETNNELALQNRERIESLRDRRESNSRNDIPVDYMNPSQHSVELEPLPDLSSNPVNIISDSSLPPIIPLD